MDGRPMNAGDCAAGQGKVADMINDALTGPPTGVEELLKGSRAK